MATFRVGQRSEMMIANVGDVEKEKKLNEFDVNRDGAIGAVEAARYYADQSGGLRPQSFDEIFSVAGGRQHEVRSVHKEPYGLGWYAHDWKGDFNIPELGAGNVRTGRNKDYRYFAPRTNESTHVDAYAFLFDCDLMDIKFLENDLRNASLVVGPKGFEHEEGSDHGEAVSVPLDLATQEGYRSYSRGGGAHWVPEKKLLGTMVRTEDLRTLAGDSGGISFYARLETDRGIHYMNLDGKPFKNFEIDAAELRPDTP